MEQLVRVRQTDPDGTAQVVRLRESACSGDCHQCAGCGAVRQEMVLTAENPIGAEPGDLVYIRSDSRPVLKAAALLYLLPTVLFLVGYIAGQLLWDRGIWTGLAAAALCLLPALRYDRRLGRHKTVYTVTALAEKGSAANDR